MERCPNCGVETRPGDQFCLNCGNRLTGSQPAFNQNPAGGPPPGASPVQSGPWPGATVPAGPQFPPPNQWGPPPGTPPVQSGPWPGAPVNSPTAPTMPTAPGSYGTGTSPSGPTVPNSRPGFSESPTDAPTVVTPLEVLEPTVRAPVMDEPEALERTMIPQASQMAAFSVAAEELPTVSSSDEELPTVSSSDEELPTVSSSGEELPTVSSSRTETQAEEDEEEVEVTITTVNEAPAKLVVSRNGQAREFLLKKPDISIGRAPSNDVALSGDQLASRRHALIHFDGVNYTIRDLVSANGTYINGVELRAPTPLSNGDHVGIGEHELVFFTVDSAMAEPPTMTITAPPFGEANPETVPVPGQANTRVPSSPLSTMGQSDDWDTAAVTGDDAEAEIKTTTEAAMGGISSAYEEQESVSYAEATATSPAGSEMQESTIIERIELTDVGESSVGEEEVEEEEEEPAPADISIADRLRPTETPNEEDMPLPVPQLPEIPSILSAIKSLDSTTAEMRENLRQAKQLEEEAQQLRDQLRAATDAISNHDNSVAVLAQRLRVGVADVSNRLNKVIEEVQRADDSLSIVDLMKLIDDVRSDPRDIYTLGSLARRARELAQFFELHQHVNQILTECLTTLNALLSADMAKPEN